jgi:hypothetical protein
MKSKKISVYVAALVITVFGAGATLMIVTAIQVPDPEYANLDPFSPTADFGR